MSFIVGILTVFLVLNCALLILLILIQLPKKDAGAGMAFGGAAADALFGAGSGNVLTKVTKYATVVFFVLALFLGYLQDRVQVLRHPVGLFGRHSTDLSYRETELLAGLRWFTEVLRHC